MATYYVGPSGSDANSGLSWALRKLTIQAAVNVATTAGDTIYVGPGTYRETVTMGTSGTAGNVISLIGDYTGANTSGTKGVVRITGLDTDAGAPARAKCLVASSKSYLLFDGFLLDGITTGSGAYCELTSCDHITVQRCAGPSTGAANRWAFRSTGASQAAITFDRIWASGGAYPAIAFDHTVAVDNCGHVVTNCILSAYGHDGIQSSRIGGIAIANCVFFDSTYGVRQDAALTAGQTITLYNSIFVGCSTAIGATSTAFITEDYNTIANCNTVRSNVTAGANSVTRAPLFDSRWFFEAVNGGRLITPWDLASYSGLVEYNSGTGAPSTDLRGASTVGTYREWGALEHSANYRTQGPVSIAPIGGIG